MDAPIGIFDSGLGGLTVLREIAQLLPHEDLIYVGDTARVPYGNKSEDTIFCYSQEICSFLQHKKVKAIVIACNTASALALPRLVPLYPIPLLGVIEPGARAAAALTQSQCIGVIGTEATIRSQSYAQALQKQIPHAVVYSQACPLFVPLVEEGWIRHEVTRQVVEIYLGTWRGQKLDTLILGCTHYPLLKPVIQEVLGNTIRLVDSAHETARALRSLLQEKGLASARVRSGTQRFFTTDAPQKLRELGTRFLGYALDHVEKTDLSTPSA